MKLTMKTDNIVPLKKLALLSAAVCAVMLAFSQNASATPHPLPPVIALGFNDTSVVGTITPASPADPVDVANYINFMIGLMPGHSDIFLAPPPPPKNTQIITRSTNLFANLPLADANIVAQGGPNDPINLGAGGIYSYLFAKYDGKNDSSIVWYVGNLSGAITIPLNGPLGKGLSGWILFGPGTGVPTPDGGATVMLLGTALGALGMVRRFLMG
jgi:VPDSG-CTERM motif